VTPTQVRQVITLAAVGNFRRAAATLKISQPALSKAIQAVEKELGVRLFDRKSRAVTPTDFGERGIRYGKRLLQVEEDLLHDLALTAGLQTGRINVALGPYPSVISGYAAAARLIRGHPGVAVGLHVSNWREVTIAVAERRVDLGIAELTDAFDHDSLATEDLGAHRARFFCRPDHPILRRKQVRFADVLDFPWATTRIPPRVAAAFPRPLGRAGSIDPDTGDLVPAIELDVPMQVAAFARETEVLTLGTFAMVEPELRSGALATVPAATIDFRGHYGFIWLRHRTLSPAAIAYMQAVREEERSYVAREASLATEFGQGGRRRKTMSSAGTQR
jgi:DNA-binding transcriptional LysR family regulator